MAGVLARRRLDEGEFAYVFLATGEQVLFPSTPSYPPPTSSPPHLLTPSPPHLLTSSPQIAGKKAAYKRLKAEVAVFEELRAEHGREGETDLGFDSRILKILTNVPFEVILHRLDHHPQLVDQMKLLFVISG